MESGKGLVLSSLWRFNYFVFSHVPEKTGHTEIGTSLSGLLLKSCLHQVLLLIHPLVTGLVQVAKVLMPAGSGWESRCDLSIIGDSTLEMPSHLGFSVMLSKLLFSLVYRFCPSMFCPFSKTHCSSISACVFKEFVFTI